VIAENSADPAEFLAFGVMNCSLTTVKMECINWVTKDAKEADNGYKNWSHTDPAKFWWFDGRSMDTQEDPVSVWGYVDADDVGTTANKLKTKSTELIYDGSVMVYL